jgi:hypothetical protein
MLLGSEPSSGCAHGVSTSRGQFDDGLRVPMKSRNNKEARHDSSTV